MAATARANMLFDFNLTLQPRKRRSRKLREREGVRFGERDAFHLAHSNAQYTAHRKYRKYRSPTR